MSRRKKYSDDPFGSTIERLMTETGLTYRGLAAKTNLSAGYLNHLVHGNLPRPPPRTSWSGSRAHSGSRRSTSASTACA